MCNAGTCVTRNLQLSTPATLKQSSLRLLRSAGVFRPANKPSRKHCKLQAFGSQVDKLRRWTMRGNNSMVAFASEIEKSSATELDQDKTLWLRSAGMLYIGSLGTNVLLAAVSQKVTLNAACGATRLCVPGMTASANVHSGTFNVACPCRSFLWSIGKSRV